MVEVIVTAIIFVASAAGIYTTLTLVRPDSKAAADKVQALYKGKEFLEGLHENVRPSEWNQRASGLRVGSYPSTIIDGYRYEWTVEPVVIDGQTSPHVRKVTLDVTY